MKRKRLMSLRLSAEDKAKLRELAEQARDQVVNFLRFLWVCLQVFALHMRIYFAHRRLGPVVIRSRTTMRDGDNVRTIERSSGE